MGADALKGDPPVRPAIMRCASPPAAPRGAAVLVLAVLTTLLVAGCVGSTGNECYDLQGQVPFALITINGTGGAYDTSSERWSVNIECSEPEMELSELRFVYAVPGGTELVVEDDRELGQTMTWFAPLTEDAEVTPATTADPGSGPTYRLRLLQEKGFRDDIVDRRDIFLLHFTDGEGARSYEADLPYGTYVLRIEDRATGEELGRAQWRFFDPSLST